MDLSNPYPRWSVATLQLVNTPSTLTASESSGVCAADVTLSTDVLVAIDENPPRRR